MNIVVLLIIQAVLFAGLVFALRGILSRNVSSATTHLTSLSEGYEKREAELAARYEAIEKKSQDLVMKAQKEASSIKDASAKESQEAVEKLMQQAHDESEKIVEKAIETKEMYEKELNDRVDAQSFKKACELIQELLPEDLRKPVHRLWLDELLESGLDQVKQFPPQEDENELIIKTAFPLEETKLRAFEKKIKNLLKKEFEVREEVDPKLVAGVVMQLGSLVLDASMIYKLQEASKNAKNQRKA